jgi:hypothetical protein
VQYNLVDLNLDFLRRIPAYYPNKPDWGTSEPHNTYREKADVIGVGGLVAGILYNEIERKPGYNNPDG